MIALGLDLSLTQTGVCVLGPGSLSAAIVGSKLTKGCSVEDEIARLLEIKRFILRVCKQFKPDVIGIEGYAYGSFRQQGKVSASATGLAELAGIVKVGIHETFGKTVKVYQPNSARKIALGKGFRKKSEAIDFLKQHAMYFNTEDEADAFVVAIAAYCDALSIPAESFWRERVWES